jgi:regulator of sirC expression with transglutaminase-like and TPR domain
MQIMTTDARLTWEKLVIELKLLRSEDFGALVPLCIGIQSVLWPTESAEACQRHLQFMGFEILKSCEGCNEAERWEILRAFVFSAKGFQISSCRVTEIHADHLLVKPVLEQRIGHPLAVVLLLLHLAHILDLPVALIQARHHFLLKWVRSGQTIYLDLYNEGRALSDQELIQVLNRSSSSLEVWSAKQLVEQYLELLVSCFERTQDLLHLHIVYNLILQLDESNTTILGQRALVRQKLGFQREALVDLKRYFSFVEKSHAPTELQQCWLDLQKAPPPESNVAHSPSKLLH